MLPSGRAKNRRRRRVGSLKGQRRPRSPQPQGGRGPPLAALGLPVASKERHRNRGDARARVSSAPRPRLCGGSPAVRCFPAAASAAPLLRGLSGAAGGRRPGSVRPSPIPSSAPLSSPQRRAPRLSSAPLTSAPGSSPQSRAEPFTSGLALPPPVKRQLQKSGLGSVGEDAKRCLHAVFLRRVFHPALRCWDLWTRRGER